MSNTSFERTVTVTKHANYGAFLADDRKFYKPVNKELTLEHFKVGQTYNVKGYSSETGKTNYVTMILTGAPAAPVAAPVTPPVAPPVAKRRLDVPKEEPVEEKPGDDKGLTLAGGRRDFKKEAKGKTLSLFIAALLRRDTLLEEPVATVERAEKIINIMDEKGYF